MLYLLLPVAAAALLVVFGVLEEHRRPEVAVFLVAGVALLDAVLFPHQGEVPLGPFRPALGGQDVRTVDVLIGVALLARLLVRGLPRRLTAEGLTWSLFFGWYAFAGVVGFVRDQPLEFVLFQEKLVLEAGGMLVLVAGTPIGRLTDRRVLDRFAVLGGSIAAVLIAMAAAGMSIPVPGLRGAQLGTIAPDAATILFTFGLLVLVVGACREEIRGSVLLGGGVMASAPFVADQRAALVGLVPAILVVAIAMGGRVWPRRSPVRMGALIPVLAVVLLPICFAAARAASQGESATAVPIVERLDETFGGEQKQASADVRVGLLREGRALVADRPILGQGLGQPVVIFDGSGGTAKAIGDFHNVLVDLAVRTGVSGVALFVVAVGVTIAAAVRRWGALARDAHAALVLAAGAALGGLLVKGMFETIFQKFRLAVVLGLLIGIVASAASAARASTSSAPTREAVPSWT